MYIYYHYYYIYYFQQLESKQSIREYGNMVEFHNKSRPKTK